MKLVEYQRYDSFDIIKFDNDIEVTLRPDGKHTVECDSASFEELQEVIEIIKSGKVVIEV